jgi:hypothetical protein
MNIIFSSTTITTLRKSLYFTNHLIRIVNNFINNGFTTFYQPNTTLWHQTRKLKGAAPDFVDWGVIAAINNDVAPIAP